MSRGVGGRGPKRKGVRERLGEYCQMHPPSRSFTSLLQSPLLRDAFPDDRIFKGKPNAGLPDPPPLLNIPPRSTRCVFYSLAVLHIFLVYLFIF